MIRAAIALAVLVATASPVRAQENSTAFSVDRFTSSPSRDAILGTEEPHVLSHLEIAAGVVGSVLHRPITLEDVGGAGEVSAPVKTRFGADLLAAIGLGSRYQLGLALPLILGQSGDRLTGLGFDETELQSTAIGDLRLHAKVRLGGARRRGLATAVAMTLSFPTGDEDHFAGEAGSTFGVALVGGWRDRWWRLAGNVGARFRNKEVVLFDPARPHTSELLMSLAVAVTIPRVPAERLDATVELAKVFGDCKSKLGDECVVRGYSPGEARLGARVRLSGHWALVAGVGVGFTPDEVGSPEWRLITGVRWRDSFADPR